MPTQNTSMKKYLSTTNRTTKDVRCLMWRHTKNQVCEFRINSYSHTWLFYLTSETYFIVQFYDRYW